MSRSRIVTRSSTLLAYLFQEWPETKKKEIRFWLKFGSVGVNGRVVKQFDHPLRPNDRVEIHARGVAAPGTSLPGGIRIRLEDKAIIVVEKPAGLLSMASASEPEKTIYAILTDHVRHGVRQSRERIWIVHRLDRETSGLMIFARTEAAKRFLQENWGDVEKKYLAVIEGALPADSGLLELHLDESNPLRVYAVKPGPQTRHARTHYRVVKKGKLTALVELTLETGRRHQIRVQLAEAGCPIVGDKKYGAKTNPIKRVALHASKLRFRHPVTEKEMRFESPLPGDLGRLI